MASPSSQSSKPRGRSVRTAKPRTASGAIGGLLGALIMSLVAGVLVTVAVTPVVAVSGIAANSAISIFENLPNHLDPGRLAQPSTLYAKDGKKNVKIATFYAQDRQMVEWDQISQYVKDAAVAGEDPRYYTHAGIDVWGLGRAILGQVTGNDAGGASTITMQYVRNVLIQQAEAIPDEAASQAAYEDAVREDADRKLKEMRLAISVEKEFSKDEILLGYLNIALFGRTVYGIESAANYYYNKDAADLTLSEAASLIAIVNNPSKLQLDIPENIPANTDRRNYILGEMLETGRITQAQYDEARATVVEPDITPRVSGCSVAEKKGLGHFCDYVQRQILADPAFGNTRAERNFNFLRGGFDIYTTIDLDMQEAGLEAMESRVPRTMPNIDVGGASVSVEVGTGRVLAMVQNRPFSADQNFLKKNKDYTSINYNTDFEYGGSSGFQVGSTFKPITLAEWLRTGHSIRDIVDVDGRRVQENSFRASCFGGGVYGYGSFEFSNDNLGTRGNQTVLTVLERSINGGIVSMQQKMDLCDTFTLAQNLGIHRASDQPVWTEADAEKGRVSEERVGEVINPTLNGELRDLTVVPSNVYGGVDEIAPITMASAYAAFTGGGEVCTPISIDKIVGPDGEKVPFTPSKCRNGISPEVAAGVAYTLQRVVSNGLADHARSAIGIPHIGKTGTTNDVVDNWTVGASTEVATAVWVGNVTGKVNTQQYGGGWGGIMTADQTIWPAIMNVADRKYGGEAFPEPAASALKQTMATVPDVSGKSYDDAADLLEAAGFSVSDGGEQDSPIEEGRVAETNPGAGASIPAGSGITIYRSNGNMSELPDVIGMTFADAKSALGSAGFSSVVGHCETNNGNVGEGQNGETVTASNPGAGEEVKRSSQVTLRVDC